MTRLAFALAALLAALLAAVVWVLARPRWRWDPWQNGGVLWYVPDCGYTHAGEPGQWTIPSHCPDGVAHWSTGSPPSVTSRVQNGTSWRDSDAGFGEAG
jgi:hypothetical protein